MNAELSRSTETDTFVVWELDDIDSSSFEDTDEPWPLYVALLCVDCTDGRPDVIRGYDPADGIFERPGRVVEALGGIDVDEFDSDYAREIVSEMRAEFESRRDAAICRGEN